MLLIDPEVKAYDNSLLRKALLVSRLDPTDDVLRSTQSLSLCGYLLTKLRMLVTKDQTFSLETREVSRKTVGYY